MEKTLKLNQDQVQAVLNALDLTFGTGTPLANKIRKQANKVLCVACGDFAEPHEAHIQLWQTGNEWIPACCDRVLDWWANDSCDFYNERVEADAPAKWILPLDNESNV